MILASIPPHDSSRDLLHDLALAPEEALIAELSARVPLSSAQRGRIMAAATALVDGARQRRHHLVELEGFLAEYRLATHEGVVLMGLAEALLRIPDRATVDLLIRDRIGSGHWEEHLGHSPSALVNASTWALMLGGRMLHDAEAHGVLNRLGETVLRQALSAAMSIMGRHFVMGRTIAEALDHSRAWEAKGYRHSFDMLGEAARTARAAADYLDSYAAAIVAVGKASAGRGPVDGPGISVKLSALHPRYEMAQRERVGAELTPRLLDLCRLARSVNIGLTVDAEEAERLDLSLDVIGTVLDDAGLAGWDGFGLAVQAYQKRARPLIGWLAERTRTAGRRLMVRLVKGAYWDSEIKRAQERGLASFPVFTRKSATDISYLACAADLLAEGGIFHPQFATHNAHTMAAVRELAGERTDWEYQRLHGMGEALYHPIVAEYPCRTYAPVGRHETLLPYLVRRLLENGANSSFVNRMADETLAADEVVTDPLATPQNRPSAISLPADLFAPARRNSTGLDLSDPVVIAGLDRDLEAAASRSPPVVVATTPAALAGMIDQAGRAFSGWDRLGGEHRAAVLERAADLFESARPNLMRLAVIEAGKTVPDALAEVREAVDFLRFYAVEARGRFGPPTVLPGPAGESNELWLGGRGVFACISPWNFPLAIFTGQVAAALAAGNAVVAKPAEQTPGMAAEAVSLLHRAGIPEEVLHLAAGGPELGRRLVAHPAIAGVAFTGSIQTARAIHRTLAAKDGPIVPLIAETGGINAMIVDSSALVEQVVADVMESAFRSAGQRCSALRALFVQREAWTRLEPMLAGAMAELRLGNPALLATDIGPVIDNDALAMLEAHAARLETCARLVAVAPPARETLPRLFAPRAYEIADMTPLDREVFGPILHILPWEASGLDQMLDAIAATGTGLTLGVHSRIESTIRAVAGRLRVGNIYVNRSMIGAVVGSQPFGGLGLSGTGPKAGGPHTLVRYAAEFCRSVNTAAVGGDARLLGQAL
ncbi:L-glutamate gamma-semialdehyde dehydrogenase [Magnetospirillum sp. SS-4]|uniref:L-glutamate gamma-semialdehyde dehydrogenase n=1 Tax=Magnetospirillum sp. SS-4 TaxID=2681465 RepID=UPI001382263C|nr:L-glutamate gamma-semialdehyde dehydrogenase [Magnetospirillum sp. SS-4]CAA7613899.1 Bifunctional proline dehydrogenase/pyrroline-5-carboxylate dehydrogenase [Magnetospirillum sp. SS-4]